MASGDIFLRGSLYSLNVCVRERLCPSGDNALIIIHLHTHVDSRLTSRPLRRLTFATLRDAWLRYHLHYYNHYLAFETADMLIASCIILRIQCWDFHILTWIPIVLPDANAPQAAKGSHDRLINFFFYSFLHGLATRSTQYKCSSYSFSSNPSGKITFLPRL